MQRLSCPVSPVIRPWARAGRALQCPPLRLLRPRYPRRLLSRQVRPCVLHGDLWSGNMGAMGNQPAVFDPATYYGHSEAEFGMSWCAGKAYVCKM